MEAAVLSPTLMSAESKSTHSIAWSPDVSSELLIRFPKKQLRLTDDELFQTLKAILKFFSNTHIVVDALDECPAQNGVRSKLVSTLRRLQEEINLHLMFTSRFIKVIEEQFKTVPVLEVRATESDVRLFVSSRIDEIPLNRIRHNADLRQEVEDKVSQAVDGMFLLARLYTESLPGRHTPRLIRQAIDQWLATSQSKGIELAYDEDYDNESSGSSPSDEGLDADDLIDIEEAVSVCAGLVTVDEESDVVRLVHFTTQEYLGRTWERWAPTARTDITSKCLTYLMLSPFQADFARSDDEHDQRFRLIVRMYPFILYAASYWGYHIAGVEEDILDQARRFLQCKQAMRATWIIMDAQSFVTRYFYLLYSEISGIHLISRFGLLNLAKRLYPGPLPKDILDAPLLETNRMSGNTPLAIAAEYNSLGMVQWLFEKGATLHINTRNEFWEQQVYHNALVIAARRENEQMLGLLLDRAVDKSETKAAYSILDIALYEASRLGREKYVELLLDAGADANAYRDCSRYVRPECALPLEVAIKNRHEHLVPLLLNRGADVRDGCALVMASTKASEHIVKTLIERGAMASTWMENPILLAASRVGSEKFIRLLIDAGHNSNTEDEEDSITMSSSALTQTCISADVESIGLPLDSGTDIYVPLSTDGWTSLEVCSSQGHEQVELKLLRKAAGVGFALLCASARGRCDILKILLDAGANVNVRTPTTALRTAVGYLGGWHEESCLETMQFLIDAGADVNAYDEKHSTVLSFAICARRSMENIRIPELLINAGADVNVYSEEHSTALSAACAEANVGVSELLIKHGADVDARSGESHSTALEEVLRYARNFTRKDNKILERVYKMCSKTIQLLLDAGAKDIPEDTGEFKIVNVDGKLRLSKDIVHPI